MKKIDLIDRAKLPTLRIEINKRVDDETMRLLETLALHVHDVIQSAPVVDAEPVRHARWFIKVNARDRTFTCSACRKWIIPFMDGLMNYCPNCGAKMDGAS